MSISDDLLRDIIVDYIPKYEWPKLELVSKDFRRVVQSAYRSLRILNIEDFYGVNTEPKKIPQSLKDFLKKLNSYFPLLDGLSLSSINLDAQHFHFLKEYNLIGLSFKNCGLNLAQLGHFLNNSTALKNLNLDCCQFSIIKGIIRSDEPYLEASKLFPHQYTKKDQNLINAEEILDTFSFIEGLESLNLIGMKSFTGKFLLKINSKNLKHINFSESRFYSTHIYHLLRRCYNLESFSASTVLKLTSDSENIIECLPNLTKLCKIFIGGNIFQLENVDDVLGLTLRKCENLREICILENSIVTDRFLIHIFAGCPNLEVLRICVNNIKNIDILNQVKWLKRLKSLCLCENGRTEDRKVVSASFVAELPYLDRLENVTINVVGQSAYNMRSLTHIQNLKNLRVLGDWITNDLLKLLCETVGYQLVALEMPGCVNVNDQAAYFIALCLNLIWLNI